MSKPEAARHSAEAGGASIDLEHTLESVSS